MATNMIIEFKLHELFDNRFIRNMKNVQIVEWFLIAYDLINLSFSWFQELVYKEIVNFVETIASTDVEEVVAEWLNLFLFTLMT